MNPSATQIRIYLPTTLQIYSAHYRKRAKEGVITSTQAELLISQLERLVRINKDAIIENRDNELVNQETYYKRNMRVIESSDELVAFHINGSEGTLDAINKAKQKGIPVKKLEYTIK